MSPKTLPGDENRFPVLAAGDIPLEDQAEPWLIEGLWGACAAGVVGGHPKTCKSWLGLDMAVSVATGTPCLGRYHVTQPGPVLVYLAEDTLANVRQRLVSLCSSRGRELDGLDVHVITVPRMRLDLDRDRRRLLETARSLQPRLLLLDPMVRLHQLEENSSSEISQLLSYLREMQRDLEMAMVIVHHTRKGGSGRGQAGLALRGSGDLWAFGDSNLYLRRVRDCLELVIEHRFAPAPESVSLRLDADDPGAVHLHVVGTAAQTAAEKSAELSGAVLDLLQQSSSPVTRSRIRDDLRVKNERLGRALASLEKGGQIHREQQGWTVVDGHCTGRLHSDDDGRSHSPTKRYAGNGTTQLTNLPGETEAGNPEEEPAKG